MKNKVMRSLVYVLGILPLVVLAFVYNRLPQEVPIHWGFNGEVEYGAKYNMWMLFGMGLIFAIMFDVLPKIDPKKDNYARFGKYYDIFCVTMNGFLVLVSGMTLVECFWPNTVPVSKVIIVLVSALLAVIGNMMPKIKTNYYMGIKTPWTLSNSDVWNKTHRLGGRLMFIGGVLGVIAGLFTSEMIAFVVLMVGVVCMTVIPLVMSYIWYKAVEK